jgi:hypothetical protein
MRRNEMRLNLLESPIQKSSHRFLIYLLPNISRPVALVYLSLTHRPLSNFLRREMVGEKNDRNHPSLRTVCVFVCFVVSVSRQPEISEFSVNIIHLGINTTLGRLL